MTGAVVQGFTRQQASHVRRQHGETRPQQALMWLQYQRTRGLSTLRLHFLYPRLPLRDQVLNLLLQGEAAGNGQAGGQGDGQA